MNWSSSLLSTQSTISFDHDYILLSYDHKIFSSLPLYTHSTKTLALSCTDQWVEQPILLSIWCHWLVRNHLLWTVMIVVECSMLLLSTILWLIVIAVCWTSRLVIHCVVAFWITISIIVLHIGYLLKIRTGLSIEMRWFQKKLLFFYFYGKCAARVRVLVFF